MKLPRDLTGISEGVPGTGAKGMQQVCVLSALRIAWQMQVHVCANE
jgi:hypothetical protein